MKFSDAFTAMTGHPPFPWQARLFEELCRGEFRYGCDLPTGLGKTSVIAIWLLALAHRAQAGTLAGFPRRLVYIVNRRTVVDQATREAERLREALKQPVLDGVRRDLLSLAVRQTDRVGGDLAPLAVSTLRGQFADNAEWRDDPARAAVIVGTVDMIGSRLLFAGYGPGFKSRPLHAGFLGQDVLLVHDEAHLEPAFQELLERIASEQEHCRDFRPLRLMALTATARNGAVVEEPLLTEADRDNPVVSGRLNARKIMSFHATDENGIAAKVAECALKYKRSNQAILVFVRQIGDLKKIADRLEKDGCAVQRLAGTMRGRERDQLATRDGIFARFRPESEATPHDGTVYLICTSAGEIGIDMSADHLVCDLTPFDSMAQRFGRVNRFGGGEARVDIVCASPGNKAEESKKNRASEDYEVARARTLELLQSLKEHNASPAALMQLPAADRPAAFTPKPTILSATDILFDAWTLTTVRDLPGRPPVDEWLHGVAEWEPPETYVAWREEVELIREELLELYSPDELLEDYPLKPHELLRDRYDRVFDQLKQIAERTGELPVWIMGDRGVSVSTLKQLTAAGKEALLFKTLILPPAAGGLGFTDDRPSGLLDGKSEYREALRDHYDVADQWHDTDGNPRRCRLWDDAEPADKSMRLVRVIDTRADDEEHEAEVGADVTPNPRFWRWYVQPRSADDEGSRTAPEPQELRPHLRCAGDFADVIVAKLRLPEPEAKAVRLAARWHDLGKNRHIWQHAIGNREYPQKVLAKSGRKMSPLDLNNYRHEFGSLIDVQKDAEFQILDEPTRDLVLHLIAAHHGRARPHFPTNEVIDPERPYSMVAEVARAVPPRFARLQRKYGRWGLAYLESLLRAADIMASQEKLSDTPAAPPESIGGKPR